MNSSCQGILVTDITDHYPVFHINCEIKKKEIDVCFWKRFTGLRNKQAFLHALSEIDWSVVCSNGDAQSAFTDYNRKILGLFNQCFPKVKVRKKYSTRKPWLTEALRSSIKLKNKLYAKFKKCNSAYNEDTYKKYRNKLNHVLKIAEKKHYAELLENCKNNTSKTWKVIKSIINRNKRQQIQSKFKLNDGLFTSNKATISNKFNDFFVGIGPNLAKRIEKQSISPQQYLGDRLTCTIFLQPVYDDEIVKIVNSLNNSAPGYDDLPADILKLSLNDTLHVLVHLCNLSLLQGIFPSELKTANVLPLYKSDDNMSFNNYRPVSVLATLSKVFEKVMYKRLIDFLEKQKILYSYQFGFRRKHSSYMALMVLTDKIIKCLENGEFVIGVFLDFSKAFDTVDHDILFLKLYHYGIRGNALCWFKSYLQDRKQYVTYNGIASDTKSISCGVPQGSILGPLLFLIYINDLAKICRHTFSILFADDSNLFLKGTDLKQMQDILNSELKIISTWLKVNKLSLNINKTHFMLFSGRRNIEHSLNIDIDGQHISEVNKTKFLGVIIDNQLKWNIHIQHIAGKVSRGIGMIIKARNVLNGITLKNLYYSFVYPYFTYCNQIWGNAYATHLKKLTILQKKVIRIICHVKPRTHCDPLFKQLGLLKVKDINTYLIGRFVFKWYQGDIPAIFKDVFVSVSSVHDYNTRGHSQCLHVPFVKTNLGKQNIFFKGAIVWNSIINTGISPNVSEYIFSRALKKLMLSDKY